MREQKDIKKILETANKWKKYFDINEKNFIKLTQLTPQEQADLKYITYIFDPNRIKNKII